MVTCRIQNEIPPSRPSTSTRYRKLKSIGGRVETPDDKKDSWKQIYNSLAKIKKKERKERIRREKAPIFLHPMYLYQGYSKWIYDNSICQNSNWPGHNNKYYYFKVFLQFFSNMIMLGYRPLSEDLKNNLILIFKWKTMDTILTKYNNNV